MYGAIETKIKTTVFAKKLKARLVQLKAKREQDIAKYKVDFVTWKKDLLKWTLASSKARVDAITPKSTCPRTERQYRNSDDAPFDTKAFFLACPDAPTYPSDKQIRDITTLLRQLSISGTETIRLTPSYVHKYFGDETTTGDDR
jgi:hypothetical protein